MIKYFYLFLIVTTLASCKKEDKTAAGLKAEMVDKWSYVGISVKEYTSRGALVTTTGTAGFSVDYWQFNEDGTWNAVFNKGETKTSGTYKVTSTTKFTITSGGVTKACEVVALRPNDFTFIVDEPKVAGQNYIETTHTFTR